MPSSAASSRSGSSSGTDSSVRRARLDWARRKSSSRAINAAPPQANGKVYEPPNRPSNSPLSVSSSAKPVRQVRKRRYRFRRSACRWQKRRLLRGGFGSGFRCGSICSGYRFRSNGRFFRFCFGRGNFSFRFSTGFSTVACLDGSDGMDAVSALGFAVCGLGCSALILFRFGM